MNELEDTENESRTNPIGNENNKRTSCFYFNEWACSFILITKPIIKQNDEWQSFL